MYSNQQPNKIGQSDSKKNSELKPQSRQLELPLQVELYSDGGIIRLRFKDEKVANEEL